jgi:hypothetical protein
MRVCACEMRVCVWRQQRERAPTAQRTRGGADGSAAAAARGGAGAATAALAARGRAAAWAPGCGHARTRGPRCGRMAGARRGTCQNHLLARVRRLLEAKRLEGAPATRAMAVSPQICMFCFVFLRGLSPFARASVRRAF